MNYNYIYYTLIETRSKLRRKKKDGLFENHHITPKSLGGNNSNENLILLTPREHYIAHRLLYKMHVGENKSKMAYAFFMMCRRNPNQQRNITSKQYDIAKRYVSDTCRGENHHGFGKKLWSDEQKNDIRKRQLGTGNSMYGKIPWNKGLTKATHESIAKMSEAAKGKCVGFANGHTHSEETKRKISSAHKGKKLSKETKQKLHDANIGKKLSAETCKKMSESRKGVIHKIVTCPHCDKSGGYSAMHRWHFDKCKHK